MTSQITSFSLISIILIIARGPTNLIRLAGWITFHFLVHIISFIYEDQRSYFI